MILQILKAKWKVVAAIIGVALLALIVYGKWVNLSIVDSSTPNLSTSI